MRELKFRIWDKEKGEMFLPESQEFILIPTHPGWGADRHFTDEKLESHDISYFDWASADLIGGRYTIMQFTGLLDKNGKEIFEGDILATSNDNPKYDIWKKEERGYSIVHWDESNDGWSGTKWHWAKDDDSVYWLGFIEVIGNIYEHPDLMKS